MKQSKLTLLCFLSVLLWASTSYAQQNSSKSKSSETLYEKEVGLSNMAKINSDGLDFSPVFYQNGLVYVTSRVKGGAKDPKTGETYFELFYSEFDPNGLPTKPQPFSVNLNSQTHEGPVTFNRSGDILYFTRNNSLNGVTKADEKGVSRLKIYEARKGPFDWQDVKELPFNDDKYSVCHPSLSADGRRLYFTSDMPGGYGGYDLYFVERAGSAWSAPINMGQEVNTDKNEVFPFIHESGVLFFSSNGHQGMGGLDIFMIDIGASKWGKVTNLKAPFNSPKDDLGFILGKGGEMGFLASDRDGGVGKDDIYRFTLKNGVGNARPAEKIEAKVLVYNQRTNERIFNAEVRIFEQEEDGFLQGEEAYDVQLLPSPNSNDLNLQLIRKDVYDMTKPNFRTDRNGLGTYEMQDKEGYTILVNKVGFEVSEITYTASSAKSSPTIRVGLKPQECVQLAGRVTAENFNSAIPGAVVRVVNLCNNSEQVLQTSPKGTFSYCLPLGCDYMVYAEKVGYSRGVADVSTVNAVPTTSERLTLNVQLKPSEEDIMTKPIEEGTVIVLDDIFYDFNKSAIRSGAARELDALAQLMLTYPSMEIELISHTDSRGGDDYNMDLSLRRAESAKTYLESRGVKTGRIKAFGYGEKRLRNKCANGVECSEEEHEYNRRTEVRIVRMEEKMGVQYGRE